MTAKLVAEEGSLKGLVLSFEDGDQWVIGRDPDSCQLLVEDPSASRKHLVCRATPQGIEAENLSETNPVLVNDAALATSRLLNNGDLLKIGGNLFRFYADEKAEIPADIPKEPTGDEEETPKDAREKGGGAEPSEEPPEAQEGVRQGSTGALQQRESTEPAMVPETPFPAVATAPPPPAKAEEEERQTEEASPHTEPRHDSIFNEEVSEKPAIAEINFGLLDTGRWLLKVISGPNNGAEFSMQSGNSYIIGTDPNACDIVFHDTSVSRQHARVAVTQDDRLFIEDLKSRNGTMLDGQPLKTKLPLTPNTLVSLGTTSFIVFDREGEMQTIISPLMPSIVKVLQTEETKASEQTEASASGASAAPEGAEAALKQEESSPTTTIGAFILIGIITGLLVIVAIGTSTLFRSEPVTITEAVDPYKALDNALSPFPNVKYSFNPSTGQLLLIGHVLASPDKSQLLYALQGLHFIKSLDDSGVIIDEYVWREINQVLTKNPDWKGINVVATTPGHFIVTGYLQTRNQADRLNEYLNANFPYPDLLDKKIVVDQEVISSITSLLQNKLLSNVTAKFEAGDVILTGGIPTGKADDMTAALTAIKEIRGVRSIRNQTTGMAPEQSIINISSQYEVTGISNLGGKMSVVINGRILMKGDILDGMTITDIQPSAVFLEKEGLKYRIDFSR